jgi:xanthosine phosphorylase
VLGSGLGELADTLADRVEIPYGELPGFPLRRSPATPARSCSGAVAGLPVAVMRGRSTSTRAPTAPPSPPRPALKRLGAEALLLTNAAGSLRPRSARAASMAIPTTSTCSASTRSRAQRRRVGPRFPSLADAYDPSCAACCTRTPARSASTLPTGVYLAAAGPTLRDPGRDPRVPHARGRRGRHVDGPEVILARHCGLRVAAVSAITNLAEGMGGEAALARADARARRGRARRPAAARRALLRALG